MSDVDPAIEDRIVDLETRVTSLEAPPTIHGVELTSAGLPDYEGRIRSLETLLGALVGQLLGQVAINPELLTEVAAMNRRAREASESLPETIADLREEEPIEVASRRNLLEFAKELKVPESALPTDPIIIGGNRRHEEDLEPKRLGSETFQGPVD